MTQIVERTSRELWFEATSSNPEIATWRIPSSNNVIRPPRVSYGTYGVALVWTSLGIPPGSTIVHAEIRLSTNDQNYYLRSQLGGPTPAEGDPLWMVLSEAEVVRNFSSPYSYVEADITSLVEEWLAAGDGDDFVLRIARANTSVAGSISRSPMGLTIEYEEPPPSGSGHISLKFGATGTGVAPYVPPRSGKGAVRLKFSATGEGEHPPAEGAIGQGHIRLALKVRGHGEAPAQGRGDIRLKFGAETFAVRDSHGQGHAGFKFGVHFMSTSPPVPPPPPWEELAADPRYQAALTARHATIDARVEIVDLDDTVLATLGGPDATLPGVVSGSVSCNSSSQSWWTCSLVIDNSDLMPTAVGDLLHPLSHNRVRVWWRILLAPGTWAEIPMGTYFIQWPKVTDSGGAEVSLSVEGRDVTAEIARSQMQNSMELGGLTVTEAIEALLSEYAPWATSALEHSDHRLPAEYHAGEPGANPLTVIREIARTTGMIVHADRMGRVVSRRTPGPEGAPVAEFVEGPLCAITSAGVSVPLDRIANRVKVVSTAREDSEGEEVEPVWAVAQVDDETSPLWVGHGFYYDHYTESDSVTSVEQAKTMAKRILSDKTTLVEDIELVIFPHPHLDPFDTVATTATRVGIDGYQEVRAFSLALGSAGGQRLTLSARREFS